MSPLLLVTPLPDWKVKVFHLRGQPDLTTCLLTIAGLFTGFRRNVSTEHSYVGASHSRAKAAQARHVVRAEPLTEPGWDKIGSDDIDLWADNGGPPTPLLVLI